MEGVTVASRSRRFLAFLLDQVFITAGICVIFLVVFATQQEQISNLADKFFADPLWSSSSQLSSDEFSTRYEALLDSPEVKSALLAVAYPFALTVSLSLIFEALYYIVPTVKRGATPGKKMMRIVVHSLKSNEFPGWEQSMIRYFVFLGLGTFSGIVGVLDLLVHKTFTPSGNNVELLEGFLSQVTLIVSVVVVAMIIARADRRGLHDLLAKTIVHKEPKQLRRDK